MAIGGEGVWLISEDGRRILDGSGGAAVSCLGHRHPRVVEAMARQASKLSYAHTGFFSSEPAEALAEKLVGDEPGGLAFAYFVSGGSEAIGSCIKLARQYFIERGSRSGELHRPAPELSWQHAGGARGRRQRLAPRALCAVASVGLQPRHPAFPITKSTMTKRKRRSGSARRRTGSRISTARARHRIAFLAEPVVGATTGCVPPPEGYFRRVRDICDRHGALLILDEVMCGMGRTGTLHAWEQEGISPDIQAIAKGLGGGYQPIGGCWTTGGSSRQSVRDRRSITARPIWPIRWPVPRPWRSRTIIREEGLVEKVRELGVLLEGRLTERFGNHRHVGDIRGRGLFWAMELVADRATRKPFDPAFKLNQRIKTVAFDNGLACYPMGGTVDGRNGDHILLAPPYIATPEDIDMIVDRLGHAVDSALKSIGH